MCVAACDSDFMVLVSTGCYPHASQTAVGHDSMFFQDGLAGGARGTWALYTNSPPKALEYEFFVHALVGLWDLTGCIDRWFGTSSATGILSSIAGSACWPPWDVSFKRSPASFKANCPDRMACKERRAPSELRSALSVASVRRSMQNITSLFFQDGWTDEAHGDWAFYTDSPLRVLEYELRGQVTVGICDPTGFIHDCSLGSSSAAGILSSRLGSSALSAGLKFAKEPYGLADFSEAPAAGRIQNLVYMGYCGMSLEQSAYVAAAAADCGSKELTSSDSVEKTNTPLFSRAASNGPALSGQLRLLSLGLRRKRSSRVRCEDLPICPSSRARCVK